MIGLFSFSSYDDINRLAASSHPGIGTYNYAYNDANYVTNITGPDTNVAYTYDDAYRTVRETNNNLDYQLDYGYDNAGNLTNAASRRISTQAQVTNNGYGWDAADRLTTLTSDMTMTYFEYDLGSRRTKKTLGNGAYTTYSYDNANNLLQLGNYKSNADLISRFTYNVDAVGNRTQMTIEEPDKTDTIDYSYDNAYRLTREVRDSTNPMMDYTEEFSYDNMGNRLQRRKSTQGGEFVNIDYGYNSANQLLSEMTSGVQTVYNYDDNGNMFAKQTGADITNYEFDSLDRMASATVNGVRTGYSYDVSGKRIRKDLTQSSGGITEYWYQNTDTIAEVDAGTQTVQATYNTPFLDENVSMNKNGQMYYYMQDGLGSVRNLVDSVQSVVDSYDYNAFGEAVSEQELVQNPYRYTGREWDNETSQYNYRSRYYNPANGRFNQKDKIQSKFKNMTNLYAYVKNNPIRLTDPFGFAGKPSTEVDITSYFTEQQFKKLEETIQKSNICFLPEEDFVQFFYMDLKNHLKLVKASIERDKVMKKALEKFGKEELRFDSSIYLNRMTNRIKAITEGQYGKLQNSQLKQTDIAKEQTTTKSQQEVIQEPENNLDEKTCSDFKLKKIVMFPAGISYWKTRVGEVKEVKAEVITEPFSTLDVGVVNYVFTYEIIANEYVDIFASAVVDCDGTEKYFSLGRLARGVMTGRYETFEQVFTQAVSFTAFKVVAPPTLLYRKIRPLKYKVFIQGDKRLNDSDYFFWQGSFEDIERTEIPVPTSSELVIKAAPKSIAIDEGNK